MEKKLKEKKKKSRLATYLPLLILIIILTIPGFYWYDHMMKYVSTDDAIVDGDRVVLASKIMERITDIQVEEGDTVHANQLLVVLDSSAIVAQKEQAEAQVKQAKASYEQAITKYKADEAGIKIFQINADKATDDFNRAKRQIELNVITTEQFENVRKSYDISQSQLEISKAQLKVSASQTELAKSSIESAQAMVEVLSTQLSNTRIYSPIDGVVAKKWLMAGDMAAMGQSILTINATNSIWVAVYIEETKLKYLHLGQNAEFTIDAIPDVNFSGKIIYMANNTASEFALIPPSNASGNFTKITQRVMLKVSIDAADQGELKDYNIFPGMSVMMKLIK